MALGGFIISSLPTNNTDMARHPSPQISALSEMPFKYPRYIELIFEQSCACYSVHSSWRQDQKATPEGER